MLSSWWRLFQVRFLEEVIRCCSNNNKKLFLLFLCSFTGDFLPEDSINGQVSKLINYFVLLFFSFQSFETFCGKVIWTYAKLIDSLVLFLFFAMKSLSLWGFCCLIKLYVLSGIELENSSEPAPFKTATDLALAKTENKMEN